MITFFENLEIILKNNFQKKFQKKIFQKKNFPKKNFQK